MGINKKRIAQRQQALAKAEKEAQKAKTSKWAVYIAAGVLAVVVVALIVVLAMDGVKTYKEEAAANAATAPTQVQAKDYYADIVIQDYGTITLELDGDAAPITVENFVKLAKNGFYDGLTFHRIMEGFVMQGGCPEGTGYGDAGYEIKGEFALNGWDNPIKHERGVISMARGQEYDSASSQFFIVHQTSANNTASLDGKYAAFGWVTSGIEIVDKICGTVKSSNDSGTIPTISQPKIVSIKIREK